MRTLAFVFGLCISAVGGVGIFVPANLVWIAQHFATFGPFYVLAVVRIAFGLILISVAPGHRLVVAPGIRYLASDQRSNPGPRRLCRLWLRSH